MGDRNLRFGGPSCLLLVLMSLDSAPVRNSTGDFSYRMLQTTPEFIPILVRNLVESLASVPYFEHDA